jgi:hypothetical protein
MVFEHLHDYFFSKRFCKWFPYLFQLCSNIACGHIHQHMARVLGVSHLLAMTKPYGEVHPIDVGNILYCLINHMPCLQFHE